MIQQILDALNSIDQAVDDRDRTSGLEAQEPGTWVPAGQLGFPDLDWHEWLNPNKPIITVATGDDPNVPNGYGRHATIFRDWRTEQTDCSQEDHPPAGWTEKGVDILAAYFSFRRGKRWGIVIRSYGVERIAGILQAKGMTPRDAFIHAYNFLLRHELGHYQIDLMAANAELISREAVYLPAKRLQKAKRPPYGVAEEGLNNALARNTLPVGYKAALDGWLRLCPSGYRDFKDHPQTSRQQSWAQVMSELVDKPIPWAMTVPLTDTTKAQVPVYLLVDGASPASTVASAFIGSISGIAETTKFLKDIRKSGNEHRLRKDWDQRKTMLLRDSLAGGSHLEEIRESIYSVRIGSAARVALKHDETGWTAVMMDQDHAQFYRRIQAL